jgi:hypothetical protein
MSIYICFTVLLLTSTIFTDVNSQNAIQQYVIRKDFFTGVKAGEFTVYDTSEKNTYYRIESEYSGWQKIKLIAYPSKQEVGRLQSKISLFKYKAEISILDPQTNQWINGLIQQHIHILGSTYDIDWNGNRITMETDTASITWRFLDINKQLLAKFRIRPSSVVWTNKYDMEIFSNKYPEQIYLLGLAARDYYKSSKNNG